MQSDSAKALYVSLDHLWFADHSLYDVAEYHSLLGGTEFGGRRKSFKQIKDIPDSYLAVDDLEAGCGNRIPLWTFGLLY